MIWGQRKFFSFSREPLPHDDFLEKQGSQNNVLKPANPVEKGLRIFFLDFLRPHPQIINGRPLISIMHCIIKTHKQKAWDDGVAPSDDPLQDKLSAADLSVYNQ